MVAYTENRKKEKMTLGSLFAGIGGFELTATWAGITPIWSNEIDHYCCEVLRKNFNHEIIEADIRSLTADTECMGWETGAGKGIQSKQQKPKGQNIRNICKKIKLESPDILTGGFPCQPFSHAGKRKGKDDNRYLWPEFKRLIRELRPPWIVAENVAGLVSMENGRTLEGILTDLENENYQTEIYNIPACGVGAWHKRERIWVVANNEKFGRSKREIEKSGKYKRTQIEAGRLCGNVCNSTEQGFQDRRSTPMGEPGPEPELKRSSSKLSVHNERIWQSEPNVGRVANGIPRRVDRLKGLGNAIVPQVAYEIFKAIIDAETH